MANPLRRIVSSSQVADWMAQNIGGSLPIPSLRGMGPRGYVVDSNGSVNILKFLPSLETFMAAGNVTLTSAEIQAAHNNSGVAGYLSGTSATSGTSIAATGRNSLKYNFLLETYSFITNQLSYDANFRSGGSNYGTAGYIVGGMTTSNTTGISTIDKMTYSNDTPAVLTATLSPARGGASANTHNGNTASYHMGGTINNGGTVYTDISKMTFSTDTMANITAVLNTKVTTATSFSGATYAGTAAYIFGGFSGPSDTAVINKLTYSNETASSPGNLTPGAGRLNMSVFDEGKVAFYQRGTGGGATYKFTFSTETSSNLIIRVPFTYALAFMTQS